MYGPWDAPLELQEVLIDEDDPPPLETIQPPDVLLKDGDGTDVAFQYASAYAAQVMVLDGCLDALLDAVASIGNNRWVVTLIGARGFPLGEHRRVGGIDPRLYAEQLHVPWLIRTPDGTGRLARSARLTSHGDLAALLMGLVANTPETKLPEALLPARNDLFAVSPAGHRAIRTADWCLRQEPAAPHQQGSNPNAEQLLSELFVRPDDRWEANDVAKLCPEVLETLSRAMSEAPHPAATIPLSGDARLEC
jgi:arylsulfatase A-like enzyme